MGWKEKLKEFKPYFDKAKQEFSNPRFLGVDEEKGIYEFITPDGYVVQKTTEQFATGHPGTVTLTIPVFDETLLRTPRAMVEMAKKSAMEALDKVDFLRVGDGWVDVKGKSIVYFTDGEGKK